MEDGNEEWHLRVPIGSTQVTNLICRNCPLQIGNWDLRADLIVLDIQDFDVILGMDWLSKHCAFIDCRDMKVIFEIPSKEVFVFQGERSHTLTLISAAQVCSLIQEECQAYLISVHDVDKKEGLNIGDTRSRCHLWNELAVHMLYIH